MLYLENIQYEKPNLLRVKKIVPKNLQEEKKVPKRVTGSKYENICDLKQQ